MRRARQSAIVRCAKSRQTPSPASRVSTAESRGPLTPLRYVSRSKTHDDTVTAVPYASSGSSSVNSDAAKPASRSDSQ